jgi:hypothetical protein
MKPFNIEEAKAGKPVCTRDGRKAYIVCFNDNNPLIKIIALVTQPDNFDHHYLENGKNIILREPGFLGIKNIVKDSFWMCEDSPDDLVMFSDIKRKKKLYIAVNTKPDGYGNHNTTNASETTEFFNDIIINPPFLRNTAYQIVEVEIDI